MGRLTSLLSFLLSLEMHLLMGALRLPKTELILSMLALGLKRGWFMWARFDIIDFSDL